MGRVRNANRLENRRIMNGKRMYTDGTVNGVNRRTMYTCTMPTGDVRGCARMRTTILSSGWFRGSRGINEKMVNAVRHTTENNYALRSTICAWHIRTTWGGLPCWGVHVIVYCFPVIRIFVKAPVCFDTNILVKLYAAFERPAPRIVENLLSCVYTTRSNEWWGGDVMLR